MVAYAKERLILLTRKSRDSSYWCSLFHQGARWFLFLICLFVLLHRQSSSQLSLHSPSWLPQLQTSHRCSKKKKKKRKIQNKYQALCLFLLIQEIKRMFAFISLVRTVTFKGKRGSESEYLI